MEGIENIMIREDDKQHCHSKYERIEWCRFYESKRCEMNCDYYIRKKEESKLKEKIKWKN